MKHVVFDCDGTLLNTSVHPYELYPGIKELLNDLTQDCLLYVWTARGRASTLRILQEKGVAQFFDGFYTADDGIGKPQVAGLMTLLGTTAKKDVWMIGDSSNDIRGAKAFGVRSIGACWAPEIRGEFLTELGADFIVNHPAECSKLIRQN